LPREWVDESARFADHCQGAAMTELLMQPAPAGRNEYEVIIADGGQIVGRISLLNSAPAATPWMWVINFAFHEDREVTHGYEATREAAMQPLVRCWHREF
jgi:hypothetical protein